MKFITGNTKVATAQSPIPLATAANYPNISACSEILVYIDPKSTGAIACIGDANVNAKATVGSIRGAILEKKQPALRFTGVDPKQLFVDVETSGDAVSWFAVCP